MKQYVRIINLLIYLARNLRGTVHTHSSNFVDMQAKFYFVNYRERLQFRLNHSARGRYKLLQCIIS
jgi:hypothetical protein